jgi:hypothetical protein
MFENPFELNQLSLYLDQTDFPVSCQATALLGIENSIGVCSTQLGNTIGFAWNNNASFPWGDPLSFAKFGQASAGAAQYTLPVGFRTSQALPSTGISPWITLLNEDRTSITQWNPRRLDSTVYDFSPETVIQFDAATQADDYRAFSAVLSNGTVFTRSDNAGLAREGTFDAGPNSRVALWNGEGTPNLLVVSENGSLFWSIRAPDEGTLVPGGGGGKDKRIVSDIAAFPVNMTWFPQPPPLMVDIRAKLDVYFAKDSSRNWWVWGNPAHHCSAGNASRASVVAVSGLFGSQNLTDVVVWGGIGPSSTAATGGTLYWLQGDVFYLCVRDTTSYFSSHISY